MDKPDIKLVIGKTGSGKTVKACNLIRDARRLLIFDTMGHDYNDGVVFYNLADFKAFFKKVCYGDFRIIYRPLNDAVEFDAICNICYECGDITMLCEELDIYCRNNRTPFSFIQILKRGRHKDVHFVGVTQRPVGIDVTIRAMCNEVYVFETNEPRDLMYLTDFMGSEAVEKIKTLPTYHWLKWSGKGLPLEVGKDDYEKNII